MGAHTEARTDEPASTWRQFLLRGAAIASAVAAVIHFAVAGEHFEEYWAFGVFMLAAAWTQLAWTLGVIVRPTRALLAAGAGLNAAVIGVYVVTRVAGSVVGPDPHEVEPVGFTDAFCTTCEALVVVAALLLLVRPRPFERPLPRRRSTASLAVMAALAMVLLSTSLVDGGEEMSAAQDAADGPAMSGMPGGTAPSAAGLPTRSPAGAVTMPDGSMAMPPGMKLAEPACTAAPTSAQQKAAVGLVNASWAADSKYRSLDAAKAAGFQPVTPSGRPVVHYMNRANYKATVKGGPVLAPSAPQSLVYANTPEGAVLVAAMYVASPHAGTPPLPGGCLTQWHLHTNLCFGPGGKGVVGEKDPTCPAGSVNRVSPPMLHIWFVPVPGGPTAVDATDQQVVHAAEQVGGPRGGTA